MKWFKHATDSSAQSEYISVIENTFGLEGYARICKLMEAIASQMLLKDSPATVEYPVKKWCQILACKKKVLIRFFETLHLKSIIQREETENGIRVTFDKLRDSLDNRAASSLLREPMGDPNQSRVNRGEKKKTSEVGRDDDLFSNSLKRILRGIDLKEELVRFLLEHHQNGSFTPEQRNLVKKIINGHFSKIKSEKGQRYGSLIANMSSFVIRSLDEIAGKGNDLYPTPVAVLSVIQSGLKPLDDDEVYLEIKRRLKTKTFNADDIYFVRYRYVMTKRPLPDWLPKYEEFLIQRGKDQRH